MRGARVSHQTIQNRLHQHGLHARRSARVPDHTTRQRRHRQGAFVLDEEPVGLSAVLWWKSIHIEQKLWPPTLLETSRRILCIRHCCLVLQSGQVCLVNTELPYTLWMVLWQANTTWITSLIQSLCLWMSNTGLISSSWMTMPQLIEVASSGNGWLLEAGVPQIEWPALSPDLNPIENLWDQLSRCVDPAPQCRQGITLHPRTSMTWGQPFKKSGMPCLSRQ